MTSPTPPPTVPHEVPPPGYKGTGAWALGFLAYVPIPFIAQIMTGLIMAGVYPTHKKRGAIAHANARHAANWGLTYSTLTVVLILLAIGFAALITNGGSTTASGSVTALPLIPLGLWMLVSLVHVIVTIIGTVQASRGAVFRFPLAIRFISQ
ncbi:DUF4870 domain-containing protein [Labedella endophytica]|uniref:DUF4870 domain-containing protein n=1 Tax=Labedella endophytica TaxID=1523160 RepID=A0A3S0VBS5_9MICO|nr:DUF4870 domain-containing protein [Labedella endophytica]RUR01792.1 DUF4870 domain-containing protein [Labedella endophytica]